MFKGWLGPSNDWLDLELTHCLDYFSSTTYYSIKSVLFIKDKLLSLYYQVQIQEESNSLLLNESYLINGGLLSISFICSIPLQTITTLHSSCIEPHSLIHLTPRTRICLTRWYTTSALESGNPFLCLLWNVVTKHSNLTGWKGVLATILMQGTWLP